MAALIPEHVGLGTVDGLCPRASDSAVSGGQTGFIAISLAQNRVSSRMLKTSTSTPGLNLILKHLAILRPDLAKKNLRDPFQNLAIARTSRGDGGEPAEKADGAFEMRLKLRFWHQISEILGVVDCGEDKHIAELSIERLALASMRVSRSATKSDRTYAWAVPWMLVTTKRSGITPSKATVLCIAHSTHRCVAAQMALSPML